MRAIPQPNCPFCEGRGTLLGGDLYPLIEEFCACVVWAYEPHPETEALPITCAYCGEGFTAYVSKCGGKVEGEGLCEQCCLASELELLEPPAATDAAA